MKLEFGNPEHIKLKKEFEVAEEDAKTLKTYIVTRERVEIITEESEVNACTEDEAKQIASDGVECGEWEEIDTDCDDITITDAKLKED